jgi:hypothetical protein
MSTAGVRLSSWENSTQKMTGIIIFRLLDQEGRDEQDL